MTTLTEARIANVRNHMALEVTHDWDAVIATFEHPRYEMHGGGQVFDGEAAVRRYFELSRTPPPLEEHLPTLELALASLLGQGNAPQP